VWHRPKGAMITAMDKKKEKHLGAKMFASLAEITKRPSVTFSKMAATDLKYFEALYMLFTV
jgi:hypothetical protein